MRHDQKGESREVKGFVCDSCKAGDCSRCLDALRAIAFSNAAPLCKCAKSTHADDLLSKDIDPVYSAALVTTPEGKVYPVE